MIRKFTHYFLLSAIWVSLLSCQEDEVAAPPKPTFTADKTSAEVGEEITFTINKVNADAISLVPYGLPGGDAGQVVTFPDGAPIAAVGFKYARPGTFQAVVVANNHTTDGESVENVSSEPITITIFSSKSAIAEFSFEDISTESDVDEDAKTITVTVPYGTDVTALKATFTASPFSTVTVGGTTQVSGETANNFSSPVVYRVTADNGTTSDYTVTVNVTPIETDNTIKSISAVAVSTNSEEKALPAHIDNVNRTIVIYDTLGTPDAQFDSIRVGYELDGEFAILKYGGEVMEQDSMLNLTTMQEVVVYSQDSATAGGIQTYSVYAVDAPKLGLSFVGLSPDPAAKAVTENFSIAINVLDGTDVTAINTLVVPDLPAGAAVTGMAADGAPFVSGDAVDYSEPVEFTLSITDAAGVDYEAVYTVTVTVVPEEI